MVRAFGSLLTAAALVMTGQYIRISLNGRYKTLEKCVCMVREFQTQLEYSQRPTAEIIEWLASRTDFKKLSFLQKCTEEAHDNADFPAVWGRAVCSCSRKLFLTGADTELLMSFGELAGTTDIAGQKSLCEMCSQRLAFAAEEAKERCESCRTLCSVGGMAAGVMALVMLN